MWNFSRKLAAGFNPYENLMHAQCGKILNRQCLKEKVKDAAQLLKQVQARPSCSQLQDSHTFRNWWQFYANGEKPVSFVELQRRKAANRGFADRLKNQNAAKFIKIFTTTDPQDENNVHDQIYKELVSCFSCPKKLKKKKQRKSKVQIDQHERKGELQLSQSVELKEKEAPAAEQHYRVHYSVDVSPSRTQSKRILSQTDVEAQTAEVEIQQPHIKIEGTKSSWRQSTPKEAEETESSKTEELPVSSIDQNVTEEIIEKYTSDKEEEQKQVPKGLSSRFKTEIIKGQKQLTKGLSSRFRTKILKAQNHVPKGLSSLFKTEIIKGQKQLTKGLSSRFKTKIFKAQKHVPKGLSSRFKTEIFKAQKHLPKELSSRFKTEIIKGQKQLTKGLSSRFKTKIIKGQKQLTKGLSSRFKTEVIKGQKHVQKGLSSRFKTKIIKARSLPNLTRLKAKRKKKITSPLIIDRLKIGKSMHSLTDMLIHNPDYWRNMLAKRQSQFLKYELDHTSKRSSGKSYRSFHSTKSETPQLAPPTRLTKLNSELLEQHLSSVTMSESKDYTISFDEQKPSEMNERLTNALNQYTSHMFKLSSVGSPSAIYDTSTHVFTPIDIEQHINNFMTQNEITFDMFPASPRNWPCSFESTVLKRLRRNRLKDLRLSRIEYKREIKRQKILKKKRKFRPKVVQPKPQLQKATSCEICRDLYKFEPDQPYMIDMKKRQAREELLCYYRHRLSSEFSSLTNQPNRQPKRIQLEQSTWNPCSADNIQQSSPLPPSCTSPSPIFKQRLDLSMRHKLLDCYKMLSDCQMVLDNKLNELRLNEGSI